MRMTVDPSSVFGVESPTEGESPHVAAGRGESCASTELTSDRCGQAG